MEEQEKQPNEKLRRERELRGWSQQKVAELIGTSNQAVNRWENGQHKPGRYFQTLLCELFGKNAEELGFMYSLSSSPFSQEIVIHSKQLNEVPTEELNEAKCLLQTEELQTTDISSVLTKYLERQLAKLLDTLASGSTRLSVREIVKPDGLFIPPLWNLLNAETPQMSLVDYLLESISKHHWILLLGEAGQGKTTILKQVFTLLAQRFLSHPSSFVPLPLYIPLREISSFTGTAVEVLWAYVQDEFPLSFTNFASLVQKHRLIILFDGLDEIQSELTQHTINERVASRLFTLPAILSCRKSFYESYLSLSTLHERYFSKVELQPLALNDSVKNYISTFCQRKQEHSPTLTVTIVNLLHSSPRLQALAQRPLLLTMMLDIFTDQQERGVQDWSQAKLYQKYTEKWLKYEATKPDSVLKWNEKLILMQEVAWAISRTHIPATSPYSLYQNVTFTQRDLFFWLENTNILPGQVPISHLIDDLCFRTFLISNDGETYSFIHKSFQEYFAARFIFEHLRGRNQTVETAACALQQMLPVEVVGFLKEMFSTLEFARHDREGVISLLIEVYQHHATSDRMSVTIRQNACAYLAYIGTPRAIQFLEQRYEQESNKWVQRGMMVGMALFCGKTMILERYVEMIQTDPEIASINLGFHLIYYGDQAPENGYYDQGGKQCEGTVRSIFRRLRSEHYKDAWALDLATLRTLLHTRGKQILSWNDQNRAFLEQFLKRNHLDQGKTFQQEQQQLLKIL